MLERDAGPGIHRIEDAYVNWYLIEDEGKLTIVDTGHPASWRSLQDALRQLGRDRSDVEAIVQTHGHFDHMGFADRAHRDWGLPIWAHADEDIVAHPWRYPHERSRLRYAVLHPPFVRIFAEMGAAGALFVHGVDGKDVHRYQGDEQLDVPGRPRVVFTPGHTPGHCSLHLPDRDAVIAGDAIVTLNPYTGARGPQIVAGAATADSARALTSLDALAATRASTVLTGHGPVWRDGIEVAVQHARFVGPT